MTATDRLVVVGASLAGLRACETARSRGFAGPITLVGAETGAPYDRPPLSKKLLAGEWDAERIRLRKSDELAALDLELRAGVRAVELDTRAARLTLDDGTTLPYDGLVIATGAEPRRLPGQPDLDGVVELRTLADSLALRGRLRPGHRLTVIGAGFIGLEVAATATQAGCRVTVLEGAPAPMIRGLGPALGQAVATVHPRHGVDLRCGVAVDGIEGSSGVVRAVRLADGQRVESDTVLVAIGVRPSIDWLATSGLALGDGVVCDATLRTSAERVFAAGDCARWDHELFGEEMRVEHWTNAAEQGAAAAANLLGTLAGEPAEPYRAVPFFWSDQFERRIQFVGRAHGDDEIRVIAGDLDGDFAALYGYGGRLRGVLGVNLPKVVMPYRRLLAERVSWADALRHADA